MLGPVWAFPHGPPYCFWLFHTTARSEFRCSVFYQLTLTRGGHILIGEGDTTNAVVAVGNKKNPTSAFRPVAVAVTARRRRCEDARRRGEGLC